ncbi:TonB-dependent siderophore receptor [Azospirillum sp. A39]|uniref:TonB-dependent siderophore receptor n=1 Tax=Azospirillum sp. A39 TaxID=3462279 RepID=UPI0040453B67
MVLDPVQVLATAEEELKQAPGVSVITREDIQKQTPTNDLSEIIRRMPGVNLTGNSASGQYGNSRQIDLRGMGPENTLILIDGRPATSRNSIRMGRSGERNTRGDSNWVPAEAVERIEVIRGPAAARYGSGAAGGVVNIITRAPTDTLTGSATVYMNLPEHSEEGDTKRLGFTLSGPLAESLSFRVYGNLNKTDADDLSINADAAATAAGAVPPAGREGVKNKDVDGVLRWDVTPDHVVELQGGFSRQGNIYAGDRAVSSTGSALLERLADDGEETNVLIRRTASLTHRGHWDGAESRVSFQYEGTDNSRLNEGLAGGVEGSISTDDDWSTSELRNYNLTGDVDIPLELGFDQVLTVGAEWRKETLHDPYSMSQSLTGGQIPGLAAGTRDPDASADTYAAYIEDNIEIARDFVLTPGIRFDHHSEFGSNFGPALNASYELFDGLLIKGGVARAFKAPNLYQSNPNYVYYTRGNGCPVAYPSTGGGCYIVGNEDLDPEISINKEIGVSYVKDGWNTGLTYFHNDYKNKIIAGSVPVGAASGAGGRIFQWTNAPKAVVQGFEGTLTVPIGSRFTWSNNFTYMIENKDKTTGEPLSVIPKYTINSWLDWTVTERLSAQFSMTHYGRQEPRSTTSTGAAASGDALDDLAPYTLLGTSASYAVSDNFRVTGGISNLLDKRIYRESTTNTAGAATYNEPGRTYYVTLTASF